MMLAISSDAHADVPTSPAFSGQRGLAVVQTFMFPRRHVSNPQKYDFDPYTPRWSRAMPRSRLDEIRNVGFDFLRVAVDPGPMMEASGKEFDDRLSDVREAVSTSLQAGLKVVLDIHVSDSHSLWGMRQITAGYAQPAFQRYMDVVVAFAHLLSTYDPARVALELFNEPPPPCVWRDRPDWNEQLGKIYQGARLTAPKLTLLVAGSCWASIDGLLQLDGRRFDANVMFVFHFYEPRVFTHQGYWGAERYLKYLPRLPYPPDPAQLDAELSRVEQKIRAATDIPDDQRAQQARLASQNIRAYFRSEPSKNIEQRFSQVRNWAARNAIDQNRIVLGEFGVMKDVWSYTGADPQDRARWLAAVRSAAERNGFRWIVWAMSNTMGIVTGDVDGLLDPTVLRALFEKAP
jgi:hypothetical protein